MNEAMLLVMRYLDNNNSVTKEEMKACYDVAASYSYSYSDSDYYANADAANFALAASVYAASAALAAYWVERYFVETGEDRAEYDAEVIKLRTEK